MATTNKQANKQASKQTNKTKQDKTEQNRTKHNKPTIHFFKAKCRRRGFNVVVDTDESIERRFLCLCQELCFLSAMVAHRLFGSNEEELGINMDKYRYISLVWPPPCNSDHQDYYMFGRGSRDPYKPLFATVTGRGPYPIHTWTFQFGCLTWFRLTVSI